VLEDAAGAATIDAWTVVYGRDGGPVRGIVIGSLAAGGRFVACTPDSPGFLAAFASREQVGSRGVVRRVGDRLCFEP
jgi:hypothetical protein